MNFKNLLIVLISVVILISCNEDTILLPDNTLIVVQAYLYAQEPVRNIRLTETLSIDSDTTAATPINSAEIYLQKGDSSFALVPSAGDSGYYHYPGTDLQVNPADEFELRIYYQSQEITAGTVVPEKPEGVSLSGETLELLDLMGMGPGNFELVDSNAVELSWSNENGQLYYVVLDNVEENPIAIDTGNRPFPRRFISQPMNRDFYRINQMAVSHYGLHRVKLYRINQEYADLYQSRQQDSRDLNEPLTNIENGLGVFSAFASDSVFFTVE